MTKKPSEFMLVTQVDPIAPNKPMYIRRSLVTGIRRTLEQLPSEKNPNPREISHVWINDSFIRVAESVDNLMALVEPPEEFEPATKAPETKHIYKPMVALPAPQRGPEISKDAQQDLIGRLLKR